MDLDALIETPVVRRARERVRETDDQTLREQLRLVEIPAPSFGEAARAEYLRERLRDAGLAGVRCDEVGNVVAALPSDGPRQHEPGAGAVLVAAHLDTVFPAETDVTPRVDGSRVLAPGITDNARGLAALLAVARVLAGDGVRTARPLWFLGTVGEEGIGDLRGVKHLFREGSPLRRAAAFVSLDGSGVRRVVHRAIGSRRLRVEVAGAGGHSWADWGTPNPVHALGAAVSAMRRLRLGTTPPTTLTVARIGGGTSVNVIPDEAWMEIDIRSEEASALADTDAAVRDAIARAVDAENRARRRGTLPLSIRLRSIGERPSGATPREHPLVRAAIAATREVGAVPELVASSTDANVPMSLGVPAITIGAGGESGGVHTTEEWYENLTGPVGIERALLTILGVAGLRDEVTG